MKPQSKPGARKDEGVFETYERSSDPSKTNDGSKPNSTTKSFAQTRLEWLDYVARDNGLNDPAYRVGAILNGHLSQKKGTAFPHMDKVANIMGVSEQTVSDAIKLLIERGHLVKRKSGVRNNNEYLFYLGQQSTGKRYGTRNARTKTKVNFDDVYGDLRDRNEHSCREPSAARYDVDQILRLFLERYPRNPHRAPERLIRNMLSMVLDAGATEQEILAGAAAYQHECGVGDIEGTPEVQNPTRWLNLKGWRDISPSILATF